MNSDVNLCLVWCFNLDYNWKLIWFFVNNWKTGNLIKLLFPTKIYFKNVVKNRVQTKPMFHNSHATNWWRARNGCRCRWASRRCFAPAHSAWSSWTAWGGWRRWSPSPTWCAFWQAAEADDAIVFLSLIISPQTTGPIPCLCTIFLILCWLTEENNQPSAYTCLFVCFVLVCWSLLACLFDCWSFFRWERRFSAR